MSEELTALNKQAIAAAKQHLGKLAWPTLALMGLVLIAFVVNLALFAYGVTSPWLAMPILAALTYMSYTPLHEAVHGNIHGGDDRRQWLNDLCGYAVATLIAVPYQSH